MAPKQSPTFLLRRMLAALGGGILVLGPAALVFLWLGAVWHKAAERSRRDAEADRARASMVLEPGVLDRWSRAAGSRLESAVRREGRFLRVETGLQIAGQPPVGVQVAMLPVPVAYTIDCDVGGVGVELAFGPQTLSVPILGTMANLRWGRVAEFSPDWRSPAWKALHAEACEVAQRFMAMVNR